MWTGRQGKGKVNVQKGHFWRKSGISLKGCEGFVRGGLSLGRV